MRGWLLAVTLVNLILANAIVWFVIFFWPWRLRECVHLMNGGVLGRFGADSGHRDNIVCG